MAASDQRARASGDGHHREVPPLSDLVDACRSSLGRIRRGGADPWASRPLDVLDEVHELARRRIAHDVATSWARGWQPAELVRQAGRAGPAAGVRLLLAAIAVDHGARSPGSLDPRWADQIRSLGLDAVDVDDPWVQRWSAAEGLGPADEVVVVMELTTMLARIPRLDQLIPPPGAGPDWTVRGANGGGATFGRGAVPSDGAAADPVLEKVRALLAKAESTSFEAEAEAFTAKAQQLIARHAIDLAVLAVDDGTEVPVAVRVPVDDPYVDPKSLLLQVVAHAGRCRAAFHPTLAMSTVVGFAPDIAGVEMMFTSLLVQAQTAMAAAARTAPAGSRPRSRTFRSSFLQAYASRIGQRLEEINAATVVEAEGEAAAGASILPALLAREAEVDDAVDDLLGTLTTRRSRRSYDAAGWASGASAADDAQLGGGVLDAGDSRGERA